MRKWEYDWDDLSNINWEKIQSNFSINRDRELLDKRSKDGWELVSPLIVKIGQQEHLRFYWKREILIN